MARAQPQSLTVKEQALVAETQPARLRDIDEDSLIELHLRVRRARDKYVQLHRREIGQQVSVSGARGLASIPPRRSASKAEIFEQALARVSAGLARAARASAAELRAERLSAARRQTGAISQPAVTSRAAGRPTAAPGPPRARARTPVERKTAAATRAAGRRRQVASDKAGRST